MIADELAPFELRLAVNFPREVIFINPPVPTSPQSSPLPSVQIELGTVLLYFDEWDVAGDNELGGPVSWQSGLFVHFVPIEPPKQLKDLFASTDNELSAGLFWDSNHPSLAELQKQVSIVPPQETPEQRAQRKQAEMLLQQRRSELLRISAEVTDRLFSNPDLASYFKKLYNGPHISDSKTGGNKIEHRP